MSINKKNIQKFRKNDETISVDLNDYGSVELRTYISEGAQEAYAMSVAQNIFDDEGYHPIRKDALMAVMFCTAFIINEEDDLISHDGEDVDLYSTYDVVVNKLGLIELATRADSGIAKIMSRIELAVDKQVSYQIDRMNYMLASGVASENQQAVENLNEFILRANEFVSVLKGAVSENSSKLSKVLTKKNIETLFKTVGEKAESFAGKYMETMPGTAAKKHE